MIFPVWSSDVCGSSNSYVLSEKDKQATFTGREQRLGVWILPFLVAGLFGPGRRKAEKSSCAAPTVPPTPTGGACGAGAAGADSAAPPARAAGTAGRIDEEGRAETADGVVPATREAEPEACEADDPASHFLRNLLADGNGDEGVPCPGDEEAPGVIHNGSMDQEDVNAAQASAVFDWVGYRKAFPDTPLHAAVTAMFAEYALLVGRITRRLGAATHTPMTLKEGEDLAAQARTFVLCYTTPILGRLHTTKVHKLLCHLLDAVRLHGAISNGDTSANEQQHKDDKRHYLRTNKSTSGYMRQLVRHAQGSRAVLKRNKALREAAASEAARTAYEDGYVADDDDEFELNEDDERAPAPSPVVCSSAAAETRGMVRGEPAAASGRDTDATLIPPLKRAADTHLPAASIGTLARRPGLSRLAALLGMRNGDRVRVPSALRFTARVPGGALQQFLARASPSYRGSSWHDYVAYRRVDDAPMAAERLGQVLVLLRIGGSDAAVVAELQAASGDEGPLSSRGCARLRWVLDCGDSPGISATRVRLALVPVTDCLRVVQIVPDFAELFRRCGVGAVPGELDEPGEDLHRQRFLLNAFCPSVGVPVCQH